jgi:serine-type D-Ala-D-Ala carboxypeptidase (penicillin-binding protein 5/6)
VSKSLFLLKGSEFMKKKLLVILMFFSLFNVVYASDNLKDKIGSSDVILYNLNDDSILYEENSSRKVQIASLTKIMTAIVTIENNKDLSQEVEITSEVFKGIEEYSKAGFKLNDKATYEELLYGVLLSSGADAVNAIVVNMGGNAKFVSLMNEKAKELNLTNTKFDNAIGMDSENNYSTAKDLAELLKYSLQNETFKKIFTTRTYNIDRLNLKLSSTLIKYASSGIDISYIKGAKSGFTDGAGYCLASIAEIDDVEYLLVTLGANPKGSKSQAVKDATTIYNYFSENYDYQKVISKGETLKTIKNKFGKEKEYNVYLNEDKELYLKNTVKLEDITYQYNGLEEISSKNKKGDKLGTISLIYENEVINSYDVYLNDNLEYYHPYLYLTIIVIVVIFVLLLFKLKKKNKKKRRHKKRR